MTASTALWLIMPLGDYGDRTAARLRETGYDVSRFCAAEAAVTRLNYARPDAIVVAAKLPEMQLFAFSRWVRAVVDADEVPMIALVRDRHELRIAEGSACDAVLRIPFRPAALAREIDLRVRLELSFRAVRRLREHMVRAGDGAS